jgi:hypothetical protein
MSAQPIYDDGEVIFQVIADEREREADSAFDAAVEAAPAMLSVDQLDGVPLFFERGLPHPQRRHFSFDPVFHDDCIAVIKSVRFRAHPSYGKLKRITTAGTFVEKPGLHGSGRAMDHDRWTFEHVEIAPIEHEHEASTLAVRRRYWALAAIMRSHSAFLLHGHFNADHADHLHHDNGGPFGFTTDSPATVKLVQAICRHIFANATVAIDGDYGPKSKAAVAAAMAKLELPGTIFDPSQFKRFLLRSGRLGFQLAPV